MVLYTVELCSTTVLVSSRRLLSLSFMSRLSFLLELGSPAPRCCAAGLAMGSIQARKRVSQFARDFWPLMSLTMTVQYVSLSKWPTSTPGLSRLQITSKWSRREESPSDSWWTFLSDSRQRHSLEEHQARRQERQEFQAYGAE